MTLDGLDVLIIVMIFALAWACLIGAHELMRKE